MCGQILTLDQFFGFRQSLNLERKKNLPFFSFHFVSLFYIPFRFFFLQTFDLFSFSIINNFNHLPYGILSFFFSTPILHRDDDGDGGGSGHPWPFFCPMMVWSIFCYFFIIIIANDDSS